MASTFWVGNAQKTAQVDTITVTAVAVAGALSVTINQKVITYTCVTGDTTTTAAANLYALLVLASSLLPEFGELTWANPSAGVITATAAVAGTPFTMTTGNAGGATLTLAHTTANCSPSDVGNATNWLRNGVAVLPQNGDDVVVSASAVPLLWNLEALAAVQFATYERFQDFAGQIGLPVNNALGYREYRPCYFKFVGSGTLTMTLGLGVSGQGPSFEKYNVGAQRTTLTALRSSSQIAFLGTNANNTIALIGATLYVAAGVGEVATLASATLDGGATMMLGEGVTFSGALTAQGGSLILYAAPASITISSTSLVVNRNGLTFASVTAQAGSSLTWLAGGTITALTLKTGSALDKSQDLRPLAITNCTMDGDSCQIADPLATITFSNPVTVKGPVSGGPITFSDRTVLVV